MFPPEQTPPLLANLTVEQLIRLGMDLVDTCDQFLLGGLRRQLGPNGDIRAAYAEWYRKQREEHDLGFVRIAEEVVPRSGFGSGKPEIEASGDSN